MKNLLHTVLIALAIILKTTTFNAQGCIIDYNQTNVGVYPSILPNATVGIPYDTDISFVLPTDTLGYPFTNFQIISISLPLGLSWTCNEAQNNCNYNPQLDVYGCIHISGTPLLAGNFQITALVLADLTILQGYPYQFEFDFQINNPIIMNNSGAFSYQIDHPCAPALVSFDNQQPGLNFYSWDFGNGALSNLENPAPQYYEFAGNYPVSYAAYIQLDTTLHIQLTQLTLQSMSNYGENFPSFEEADAYYKIKKNGQVIYQSAVVIDQNPPLTWWPNLDLELGQDYVIEIWEADQSIGENYFGADDYIGNHTLSLGNCTACVAGTAQIAYQIDIENINPNPSYLEIDTLILYENPEVPSVICDTLLTQLHTNSTSNYLQWYFNGDPILGQNNNILHPQQSGFYHVCALNEHGCKQSSDTLFVSVNLAALTNTDPDDVFFQVQTNPTTHQLTIAIEPQLIGAQIELWKIDGSHVANWFCTQTFEEHTINELSNGIYILKLTKGTLVMERKISMIQ